MYRLQKENVVKLTASEEKKGQLLAQGFTLLAEEQNEKKASKKKKGDANDGEGTAGAAE